MRQTYGKLLPGLEPAQLSGKLIVIEGTDGAGRTTQIDLLKPWLEEQGHAVLDTGVARSSLAGDGIRRAKEGNNLGQVTHSLFYATDFVDRLENEIVPALRAGFIVLTDRYIYSLMARAIVRGVDPNWVRKLYRMALKPDAVFYLRLGVEQLVPRVVFSRGFDYWESGMDYYPARDMYEGFCNYQEALLAEFDRLSTEYKFEIVDASVDAKTVFAVLQARIVRLLEAPDQSAQDRRAPETAIAQLAVSAAIDNSVAAAEQLMQRAAQKAITPSGPHSEMAEAELNSLFERAWQVVSLRSASWDRSRQLSAPPQSTQDRRTPGAPDAPPQSAQDRRTPETPDAPPQSAQDRRTPETPDAPPQSAQDRRTLGAPDGAPKPRPEDLAELESLFERASKWARSRQLIPPPPSQWEEFFELNLPPIASQISQAFELATQALAAGSQLGRAPRPTNGNGHSNGNGNGHAHGH